MPPNANTSRPDASYADASTYSSPSSPSTVTPAAHEADPSIERFGPPVPLVHDNHTPLDER
ncbi:MULTISPECIES: hypothetical protein [Streptomyces]|uniref:Uncharacterized protein n=1 Tax=Streptomyces stelliscabiei TaxID=146820 RepID=A0A8I0P702_9ACTN|nr:MULTISPECIES: hypothetical protein [Streptomyces]MBE1598337.1 hypothetical protein [Streptomyces stelliscabiei]MDX2521979.1 hypothetical protein [Streptomyces stelliscabiei]MDX2666619.1 hypothetical protein [Streptomyces stelliscabiei]